MDINFKIDFYNLHREGEGNVAGEVVLKLYGNVGMDFDIDLEKKSFNFPRGGEQDLFSFPLNLEVFEITGSVKVHEKNVGQCCVQGHVHIKLVKPVPIGGGVGKDLDPNCHLIS